MYKHHGLVTIILVGYYKDYSNVSNTAQNSDIYFVNLRYLSLTVSFSFILN